MQLRDPLILAQNLIRCRSVTPENNGVLEILEEALITLGFQCNRLNFGADFGRSSIANLYARRGLGKPNFCFAGHTDVVPEGDGWTVPAFEGRVVGDYLYGRGAIDMKGAIACFVSAVARLLSEDTFIGSISLLITGDEEGCGLDGTIRALDWLVEQEEKLDACILGEPTNPHHLGEMIKIGRRGSLNGHLRVLGTQGHVAYPHLVENPITRLLAMLQVITSKPLDGGSTYFQPSTLVLTSIDVGNKITNITPSQAYATFNIRFNNNHSGASLEQWLRQSLNEVGGIYELDIDIIGESFITTPGYLCEVLSKAITKITGRIPNLGTTGGISDARFIRKMCPVVEFGLVGQTMHQINERVLLTDLEDLTNIYLNVLNTILRD
ncbi:MAG: succinyl-diaminopimelate desuccinylase [Rhodospirillaceae bacterium]|nr:succinyl-diaminopimelate desuccinylase [Rhodospirillaceae bacterium]